MLAASICFLKSSPRLYRWIMTNRFFGPWIERIRGAGLTAKEKISIYLFCLRPYHTRYYPEPFHASADIPRCSSGG
ncbi:MAG: YbaN family protein [Treponema sp.]|nr:YbaN family protein [Treponema sp.]